MNVDFWSARVLKSPILLPETPATRLAENILAGFMPTEKSRILYR
jgi:hypothetical protein